MLTRRLFNHSLSASLLVGAFGLSSTAAAHREAASTTEVKWSDADKSIHITHIMHTHDAQRALFHAARLDKPDLTPLKAQAILALYMSETFSISADNEALPLNIIGAEIIGRNVYVYHEAAVEAKPDIVTINARMFQNIIDDFINHIDVVREDATESFRQTKNSDSIIITFPTEGE